jgi:hypothetical protein
MSYTVRVVSQSKAYCLERMVISEWKASLMHTGQDHYQTEGSLKDIVPF